MKQTAFSWSVDFSEAGMLLRDYLIRKKMISRQALTDIKYKGGALFVNDESVTVKRRLCEGDVVKVVFPKEEISLSMEPVSIPLKVLYEDEHFLAVNKAPCLPTIPSRFQNDESLAQGVLHYFQENGIPSTIHTINRLDRDTSGIVLFAKHRYGHSLLSRQQQSRKLNRTYVALCHGTPAIEKGMIDRPIGRKEGSIIERCVTDGGQQAITRYELKQSYEDYSLVELKLETGRTHQIRVHMASIGYPLLGDDLYGGERSMIDRQALHSRTMRFYHPFKEKEVNLEAPIPDDMKKLIQRERG
ncbi:RluA family pseudouridine synthase [Pseudalkalibacillus sp. SCS-8]|uniref:RluA family pseudouridine synthase n=1 Tax=Pseudalkalibacillus nanhaiensis TaxID=3115291 RepID=UPI0032DAC8F1